MNQENTTRHCEKCNGTNLQAKYVISPRNLTSSEKSKFSKKYKISTPSTHIDLLCNDCNFVKHIIH